jgi:hypothetical protein
MGQRTNNVKILYGCGDQRKRPPEEKALLVSSPHKHLEFEGVSL